MHRPDPLRRIWTGQVLQGEPGQPGLLRGELGQVLPEDTDRPGSPCETWPVQVLRPGLQGRTWTGWVLQEEPGRSMSFRANFDNLGPQVTVKFSIFFSSSVGTIKWVIQNIWEVSILIASVSLVSNLWDLWQAVSTRQNMDKTAGSSRENLDRLGPQGRNFRDCYSRLFTSRVPFLLPSQQHQNTKRATYTY